VTIASEDRFQRVEDARELTSSERSYVCEAVVDVE
jgi:hypothetical protein